MGQFDGTQIGSDGKRYPLGGGPLENPPTVETLQDPEGSPVETPLEGDDVVLEEE